MPFLPYGTFTVVIFVIRSSDADRTQNEVLGAYRIESRYRLSTAKSSSAKRMAIRFRTHSRQGRAGSLSGRGPSICCCKTVRSLKSPTGAFIAALRKHEFALAGRAGSSCPQQKNRAFPMGNALLYILLSYVAFGRVRPIQGRALFFYYASSFSTRSIRYPTPT